jgi:hypothetical protein
MNLRGSDKAEVARRLEAAATRCRQLRGAARDQPVTARDRAALRAWQADRLARTYRDLLASPRYGPAASFFLAELYGSHDHIERDQAIARVVPALVRLLPAQALEPIALALELDALSESLDLAVAQRLRERGPSGDLVITEATYAEAYRHASERSERERQIKLAGQIGATLDRIAHKPFVAAAIKVMEGPARAAGVGKLHDFLARGYAAFRHMNGADDFLAAIAARETRINDQIYRGAARPFDIEDA